MATCFVISASKLLPSWLKLQDHFPVAYDLNGEKTPGEVNVPSFQFADNTGVGERRFFFLFNFFFACGQEILWDNIEFHRRPDTVLRRKVKGWHPISMIILRPSRICLFKPYVIFTPILNGCRTSIDFFFFFFFKRTHIFIVF